MLLTKKLAFGGIAVAMILLVISISFVSPTADFALFTLSSLLIAIVVIETDLRTGAAAYLASGILLTVFFGIYFSIPFLAFFGLYPLLKGILESKFKKLLSYGIKCAFFAMALTAGYFVLSGQTAVILTKWNQIAPSFLSAQTISLISIFILAELLLFLYDYALTLMITFYMKRIRRGTKNGQQ